MEESPATRLWVPEKFKMIRFFLFPALFLFTGGIFFLDLATSDFIAFDVFYFPSVLLAAWYGGRNGGFLMALVAAGFWFGAHWQVVPSHDTRMALDGGVHLFTFILVGGMAYLVQQKTVLLKKKSEELVRSNEELEKFAYRAAHDLRSPLATIHGFAELLEGKQKNTGDEEAKECVAHILKCVRRMSDFIKELLNYAKVMTREAPPSPVAFDEIVRDTLEDLQSLILEKKAEVIVEPLPTLPVSPELISLLFQNLISNALKYCVKEPRVHLRVVRKGKEWLFSVRDNGIGVPKEAQQRIFIMFEKVGFLKCPGTGIGLATCQKIVERYHGRLWVESPPRDSEGCAGQEAGEGSVFFFTLPAV